MKIFALLSLFLLSICLWEFFVRNKLLTVVQFLYVSEDNPTEQLVFNQLDIDINKCLNFIEWSPFYQQTTSRSLNYDVGKSSACQNYEHEINWFGNDSDEIVTIHVLFQSLTLNSTMQNFKKENHQSPGSMAGLLNWQVPKKPWMNVAVKQFSNFLPPAELSATPGSTWWIVAPQTSQQMPSDQYEPQAVVSELTFIQDLFRMFHSGASLYTRFPPQGFAATLRAINEEYLDIMLRAHVEFQLNNAPALPFWFTPAQFQGRLIISKNAKNLIYFSLIVPNDRQLNVDMEWLYGRDPELMEVDLGYIPEMKLESTTPSISRIELGDLYKNYIHSDSNYTFSVDNVQKWVKQISKEEASALLQKRFYAFKEVHYYNISEVFKEAQRTEKLVHTLILFGSLDDQSC